VSGVLERTEVVRPGAAARPYLCRRNARPMAHLERRKGRRSVYIAPISILAEDGEMGPIGSTSAPLDVQRRERDSISSGIGQGEVNQNECQRIMAP
jgi:hypothetical protein